MKYFLHRFWAFLNGHFEPSSDVPGWSVIQYLKQINYKPTFNYHKENPECKPVSSSLPE